MTSIRLVQPQTAYSTLIDTGAAVVEIRKAVMPVKFITDEGDELRVVMRNGGIEIQYTSGFGEVGFDSGPISMRKGIVKLKGTNGQSRTITPLDEAQAG